MGSDLSIDESLNDVRCVFVYGTLMRGECNESVWPCGPIRVETAWTEGELYAGRDYPALLHGNDKVAGELWTFESEVMPHVIAALDELEGTTSNAEADLYHRLVVQVYLDRSEPQRAFGYFYNRDPIADGFTRVPAIDGECRWKGEAK